MAVDLGSMENELLARVGAAGDLGALEAERVAALGKQGAVTGLLKTLGGMTPEERASDGPRIHALREAVTAAIAARKEVLEGAALERRLATEGLDMSLPVEGGAQGSVHPVSQVMDELAEIFADLGFAVATRAGDRGRLAQFHRAQHARKPSGAGDARHLLFPARLGAGRRDAAAHPYFAGADPHHAVAAAADPDHRAGPHLSLRQRRDAHADVPPDRGAGDRQGHHISAI